MFYQLQDLDRHKRTIQIRWSISIHALCKNWRELWQISRYRSLIKINIKKIMFSKCTMYRQDDSSGVT